MSMYIGPCELFGTGSHVIYINTVFCNVLLAKIFKSLSFLSLHVFGLFI